MSLVQMELFLLSYIVEKPSYPDKAHLFNPVAINHVLCQCKESDLACIGERPECYPLSHMLIYNCCNSIKVIRHSFFIGLLRIVEN